MTFALLSRHSFKVSHVRRTDRGSDNRKLIHLGDFASALIILDEELEVRDILKLDESERNWAAVQLIGRNPTGIRGSFLTQDIRECRYHRME